MNGKTKRVGNSRRNGSGAHGSMVNDPRRELRRLGAQLADALNPDKAPSKPKTFAQMTPAEREEMKRLYEKKDAPAGGAA